MEAISPPPSVSCSTGTCTVSGDILQYTFTGLDHTQQYTVSVAAINCAGTGDSVVLVDLVKGNFVFMIHIVVHQYCLCLVCSTTKC